LNKTEKEYIGHKSYKTHTHKQDAQCMERERNKQHDVNELLNTYNEP